MAAADPAQAKEDEKSEDWTKEYEKCAAWSEAWRQVKEAQKSGKWPKGYRVANGRLLKDGVWCLPSGMAGSVLRQHHTASGHAEARRHYVFADEREAAKLAVEMRRQCETCQACEHPHQPLRLKVMSTPVPPNVMSSVAIDLFVMPEVEQDGLKWNVFAACVDRHSGWCVATPHHAKGLTAAKVAK